MMIHFINSRSLKLLPLVLLVVWKTDVAGKLGPRIDELFALQMLFNANLDDAARLMH
jgi:hypothetical protein